MVLKLSYTESSFLLFQNQADQSKRCSPALRSGEQSDARSAATFGVLADSCVPLTKNGISAI